MWKDPLRLLSFLLGLLLQALAIKAMAGDPYLADFVIVEILWFHGLGIVLGFIALSGWAPKSYRQSPATALALFFGFATPFPVVGLLFLGVFRWLLEIKRVDVELRKYHFGERQVWTMLQAADPTASSQSVLEVLGGKDIEARRRAILALRAVEPKKALPVLQKAIRDSDEQVRLLAQTILSKTMAGLEGMIKKMEAEITASEPNADQLHELAEQYHEMIYLGLSSEETEGVYLSRAVDLLRRALEVEPGKQAARFLLLKCFIKSRNTSEARRCLKVLQDSGFQPEFLAPWESEIYFIERDWTSLRRVLQQMRDWKTTDPRLRGLTELWLGPSPAQN